MAASLTGHVKEGRDLLFDFFKPVNVKYDDFDRKFVVQ